MKRIGLMMACALAALSPLIFLGCEASSTADTQLILEPRNVTLGYLDSQQFTVSGGYDYRWSLQSESLGVLNKRTGNQVVYTSYTTNATQVLTVESYILGASGNNPTNTSGSNAIVGVTATATISPLAGRSIIRPTSLTVIPSSATLTTVGESVDFHVAGDLNCDWSLQIPSYGDPDSQSGRTFHYVCSFIDPSNSVSQTINVVYTPPLGGTPLTATVTVTQKAP